MNRLPSQKKFAINRKAGGPPKRSVTAPGPPSAPSLLVSQGPSGTPRDLPSSSQPQPSSAPQLDSTLVPPGVSQLIDARLLDPGPSTQSTSLSQSATQVDNTASHLPKVTTRASRSPELSKRNPPSIETIDARLLDNAGADSTSPQIAAPAAAPAPMKPTTRGALKSPEVTKRPLAPSAPQDIPILPPPPSTRPKGRISLVEAAKTTDENVAIPYHRGKRAGSRASSRAGSRAPSQSPAPSMMEIDPALQTTDISSPVRETLVIPPAEPIPFMAPPKTADTGLPPSLGGSGMPPRIGESSSSGMPPALGSSQHHASSPEATLANATADAVNEDSEVTQRAPRIRGRKAAGPVSKPPRKPRAAPAPPPRTEIPEDGMDVDSQPEAGPSSRSANTKTATRQARQPTKRKRPVREIAPEEASQGDDAQSMGEGGDEADGEGTESSFGGLTRKAKSKKKKYPLLPYETGEAQPGDMLGEEIDPQTATMKDILTRLGGDGRISERGVTLAPLTKERREERKRVLLDESEASWRQRQVMRRQARTVRNVNKERLRQEARENGDGSDGIAKDSDDSGEEYEFVPERLTPESSPEPGAVEDEHAEGEEEEGEDGEDGEQGEEALFLPAEEEDHEEEEDEDEDIAALRRAGFTVRADDEPPPDDNEEEAPDFDPEQMSFAEYQAAMERYEANRRRGLQNAQNREVVEEDRVNMVNNASFSRKKKVRNEKWTDEETDFFYHVLGEVGENYGLMAHYFPGRSMNQVKRKGVRENKADPARVTAAIYSKKRMDVTYLRKTVGYDAEAPMDKERSFIQEVIAESERMKKEDSEVSIRLQAMENGENGQEEEVEGEDDEAEVEGEIGEDEEDDGEEVPMLEV